MKNCLFKLLSFLHAFLFLLGSTGQSSAQNGEKGLLWEITGKGIKKSYLYGTIHIPDAKVKAYDRIVEDKLKGSKAFAMELVVDEIYQMSLAQSMMMTESLQDILSAEDYAKVSKLVKEKTGQDMSLMNHIKPFMLYTMLSEGKVEVSEGEALDLEFLKLARAEKKKILGVEKVEEQLAAINSISLKDQGKMLMDMLSDTSSGDGEMDALLSIYLSQDLDAMVNLAADPTLPKEIAQNFLVGRNKVMAERITAMMKEQSTFVAVGAAHLGGPDGVIALLRKAGFTLTAVPFAFKN